MTLPVEGDRIFFDDHPGVVYAVMARLGSCGHLKVVESDEPELFQVRSIREDVDLSAAKYIGGLSEADF